MADTKIAPRRLPFEANTKLIFAQATVPPQWDLDTTDDDRFLRLVDGAGAGTGGPISATVNSVDLNHEHTQSHYHGANHTHTLGHAHTSSDTDGMTTVEIENQSNYRARDDSASPSWGVYHMRVDGGDVYEGHHDHEIEVKNSTFPSGTSNTGGPLRPSTSGSDTNTNRDTQNLQGSGSLSHSHTITNFRFAYTDVVVGILVG